MLAVDIGKNSRLAKFGGQTRPSEKPRLSARCLGNEIGRRLKGLSCMPRFQALEFNGLAANFRRLAANRRQLAPSQHASETKKPCRVKCLQAVAWCAGGRA